MTTAKTITVTLGGRGRVRHGGFAGCPGNEGRTQGLSVAGPLAAGLRWKRARPHVDLNELLSRSHSTENEVAR
jgi:hypothetical protein